VHGLCQVCRNYVGACLKIMNIATPNIDGKSLLLALVDCCLQVCSCQNVITAVDNTIWSEGHLICVMHSAGELKLLSTVLEKPQTLFCGSFGKTDKTCRLKEKIHLVNVKFKFHYIYRMSQEEWTKLRESVPYVKIRGLFFFQPPMGYKKKTN